jgi:RHS repeat-associated protein
VAGNSGKVPYGQIKKYMNNDSTTIIVQPASPTIAGAVKYENLQFYYHPDHIGSSNYMTDASGEVYQHDEYFPSGETFVQERHGAEHSSYLFSGKEQDEETGLYYFGARYLDPRIGIWYGVDPLAEKYPWCSPYVYCNNNPIRFIDPDGRKWKDRDGNVIKNENLANVKVYIFHDNDFSEQALKQYDEAVEKYGAGSVALSNTGTTEGFSADWGNMQGTITDVNITMHGKNQSINLGDGVQFTATGDGKTNIAGSKAPNVQDLPTPAGDISNATLHMNSCHSADNAPKAHGTGDHAQGDLKGSMKPIAQVFAEKFGFAAVQGTRGSVNYNSFSTNGTWPSNSNYMKPYPENGTWIFYKRPLIIYKPVRK